MCGGAARWLRVLGVDASFTPGIDDGDLVAHARAEGRVVISSDGPLFDRRVFTTGALAGVRLPVGLKLIDQVRFIVDALEISPGFSRCATCNGTLRPVSRAEVGDVVPARSLIWRKDFYCCRDCRQVFWEGSHWRRIHAVQRRLTRNRN
jgi:uncharacterized protein with PIN domain